MTLREVIAYIDDIKPNAFTEDTKTRWVSECEGYIQTEIMLLAVSETLVYDWETDADAVLLVHPPHDKVYGVYLAAMLDFANGEYQKYENAMQLYNAYLAEFRRWFVARYRPADGERAREGFYVSAYGIAVKHGFEGSEEDWLASLRGDQGAPGETGPAGETGERGAPGAVYTPSVSPAGVLSWTNDSELPNPADVNIRGPQGEQGETGPAGPQGAKGETGRGLAILGYFQTLAALQAGVAAPLAGDAYGVGSEAPYDIYIYDAVNAAWTNNGSIQGVQGEQGVTFTPSVSGAGLLSWSNDGGLENPAAVNIRGPQGLPGETGAAGAAGSDGADGATFTPSVSDDGVLSWTNDGGRENPAPASVRGPQGPAGTDGAAGPNEVTSATATTLIGLLKGNGSTVQAAAAGTDYAPAYAEIVTGAYEEWIHPNDSGQRYNLYWITQEVQGKCILIDSTQNGYVCLPSDGQDNLTIGFECRVIRMGTGMVSIVGFALGDGISSATVRCPNTTQIPNISNQFGMSIIKKIKPSTWIITGDAGA